MPSHHRQKQLAPADVFHTIPTQNTLQDWYNVVQSPLLLCCWSATSVNTHQLNDQDLEAIYPLGIRKGRRNVLSPYPQVCTYKHASKIRLLNLRYVSLSLCWTLWISPNGYWQIYIWATAMHGVLRDTMSNTRMTMKSGASSLNITKPFNV